MSELMFGNIDRVVDRALDGVLFIEDVYGPDRNGGYTDEVVDGLLRQKGARRDRLAVIFAGAPEDVQAFLAANPALRRRIPANRVIEFPGLGPDALMALVEGRFEESGLRLADGVLDQLRRIVDTMYRTRNADFAGGREMAVLANAVAELWSGRVGVGVDEPVTVDDIPESYRARLPAPVPDSSALLAELDRYVGLNPVREALEDLVERLRADRGRHGDVRPHLLFTGLPGTGKNTVARLVGRLFREFGLLAKGHVVERTGFALVAGDLGPAELLVREDVQAALDGVLFIDDAYDLLRDSEASDVLVREMEHRQGRLLVIVACDPRQIATLLARNPGALSHFPTRIAFPYLDTADLLEILRRLAAEQGHGLGAGVPDRAAAWLEATRLADPYGFGNARTVRDLHARMEASMATRHRSVERLGASFSDFLPEDVPEPPPT